MTSRSPRGLRTAVLTALAGIALTLGAVAWLRERPAAPHDPAWALALGLVVTLATASMLHLRGARAALELEVAGRMQAECDLKRRNEHLDRLVQERTAELAAKSAQLAAELDRRGPIEDELRKLSRAVEQNPAAVMITDPAGRIEYVNPRFVEITGYSAAEAVGRNPRMLNSGEQSPEFYAGLWATIRAGNVWRGEFRNRKKNGDLYWHGSSISPVRDGQGRITHFVGIAQDITERKAAAEELLRARDAADAANRAKSAFLANMSHEIRTPMNAILGFSQLMLRDPELPATLRRNLDTINRSGEHLLDLINDILEMSKIEAGRATLQPRAFDLHALLGDVEGMFRLRTDARKLAFAVERGADVPRFVVTDPGKLRQVLINLLGNAVKFTTKGGIILRVRARPEEADGVRLQAEVEDTGPGLAPEEIARLFRHFEQTQTGEQAGGGTGLGLAISREYVRQMGGDIAVDGRVGVGSVFRFEIALRKADSAAALPWEATRRVLRLRPGSPPVRVLIADDQEDNRQLLSQLLDAVGFSTRQVTNGADAVTELAAWRPALILMDLRMPGLDGREAIRRIRAAPGGAEVKIIAVSASVFEDTRQETMTSGADDFIGKPFREAELFEKIRTLLGTDYVYADDDRPASAAGAPAPPGPPELTRESVAAVPQTLREQLRGATVLADFDRLIALLGQVEAHDRVVAAALRARAEAYDYRTLLDLLS